jgi:hypothetical protein
MPNKKISAMPSLAGNQVPTDLVTAVDLSAAPVNQNVKSTLNDLFAVITKNITDRAIRFQAPGSAPAVSSASQGALYHNGTAFLASSNGGAYEQLYTLSAQSAALVFAGPTSGPAATPTFRALALTDLPTLATASLLGRSSAGTGTPEQISSTPALLTWLQNPISNNLSAAVTDSTGAGGALVFGFNPVLTNPRFNTIAADPSGSGSNLLFTPSVGAVNHIEILNATAGNGPTIRPTGLSANQPLNLASRGTGIISCVGNQLRITSNSAAAAGILELRGGNASLSGGQIRLYEVIPGTNYIGFQAPDNLASNLLFELPSTDGTSGQVLRTDGFGILSWASFVPDSITTNSFLGRTAAGTGPVQTLTAGAGVLSWLQTPTADNLRSAVSNDTGTGNLVFADGPTITNPVISSGDLQFSTTSPQLMTARASGVPFEDRFAFQTNEPNGATVWTMLPNGSGTSSQFAAQNTSNRNNFSFANMVARSTTIGMRSAAAGTGTVLPMTLEVPTTRITIEPNGNIGINGNSYGMSSVGVIAIANATANPTTFPAGGGILYVSAGALRWRGPFTDTQIAPA